MSKDKPEIQGAKNTIIDSTASAGGNLQLGDQHIVNNYYNNPENPILPKDKKEKTIFNITILKVAFISITLIGITVSIDNCNINFTGLESTELPASLPVATNSIDESPVAEKNAETEEPSEPFNKSPEKKKTPSKKPEVALSKYADIAQLTQAAIFKSGSIELPSFQQSVKSIFVSQNIRLSDTFFNSNFRNEFGSSIEAMEFSNLREIGLTKKLNCICQIKENIKYEPNEIEGVHMVTARGRIQVHILNLKTGRLEQTVFSESGAGMSESSALKSLEEHLIKSKKLKSINTLQCR